MEEERKITGAQLKLIHTLLSQKKLMEHKRDLCLGFSNGRTESSRELTLSEARVFIQYLKEDTAGEDAINREKNSIIKRIWHLGYLAGIIYGDSPEDKAINSAKLDTFAKERGTVKKPLRQQSVAELKRTVKQFEAIFQKTNEKQAVEDFEFYIDHCNKELIDAEMYEGAAKNIVALKAVKEMPNLAVKYFKVKPKDRQYVKQLRELKKEAAKKNRKDYNSTH